MNKKFKKLFSFTMALSMMISSIGCSNQSGKKVEMGRYVEERYESPTKAYPFVLTKLDDGKVVMLAQSYEKELTLSSFTSEDGGQSWSETNISLPKEDGMETSIGATTVLHDGRILLSYCFFEPWVEPEVDENGDIIYDEDTEIVDKDIWEEPEYKHRVVNLDGTFEEIAIKQEESEEDMYYGALSLKSAPNGDIFMTSSNGDSVIQLDSNTFEVKNEYLCDDYFNDYIIVGDSLIVVGFSNITEFNINTGKEKGNLEELEKEVLGDMVQYYPTFIDAGSKTKLYYYSTLGLYEYDLAAKKSKQIIDGALSSFGDSELYLNSLIEKDNNEFLAIFNDFNGEEAVYINYKYDSTIPSVPDKKIRVYSLLENDNIRQAVLKHSKANPDTYIKYEIGMNYEEGLTESDVIKRLNTEIAAGNGPDIIVLDGLPSESYIEKGLLEDISDIVLEYVNNDLIFKNIADAYTNDSKIFQIPTKIKFPILIGNKKDIESVTDLESLVEQVKKIAEKTPENRIFFDMYSPKQLVYSLYYLYGSDWLNDDNTINVEALTSFFEKSSELYKIVDGNANRYYKKMEEIWNNSLDGLDIPDKGEINSQTDDYIEDLDIDQGGKFEDSYDEMWNIYEINDFLMPSLYAEPVLSKGYEHMALMYGAIDSSWGYNSIISALMGNEELDYKILSRGEEKVFMPVNLVGVNSKSKNKGEAKEFIKGLLSEDFNEAYSAQGLPINKEKLKKDFAISKEYTPEFDKETGHYIDGTSVWQDENGNLHEFKIYMANEYDVNKLTNNIGNLTTAGTVNRVLLSEVAKQFEAYVSEKATLEDAVNTVVDNLGLYLAE